MRALAAKRPAPRIRSKPMWGPPAEKIDHGHQDSLRQPPFPPAAVEADPHRPRHPARGLRPFGLPARVGILDDPAGLLVLSVDIPIVRRWRRKLAVWWHRRKENGDASEPVESGTPANDFADTKVE